MEEQRGEHRSERRVHLSKAAAIMGLSKDAVRMRVKRGTLRSEKGEDGRVYVWVNVNPNGDPNDVHPQGEADTYRELVEELRDRVRSLEEANRENRRIIAGLVQRVPELPAGETGPAPAQQPEATESREAGAESRQEAAPSPAPTSGATDAQTAPEEQPRRRSWWREFFGIGE